MERTREKKSTERGLRYRQLYWLIGCGSDIAIQNKILWTYGINNGVVPNTAIKSYVTCSMQLGT